MKYILLFDDITLCRESTVSFWRIERHFMCMLFSHIFCLLFNRHRMKYPDLYVFSYSLGLQSVNLYYSVH